MNLHDDGQEQLLVEKLRSGDKTAFTVIFRKYYKDLVCFSFAYTRDTEASEEIIQEVFLKLWEHRSFLQIKTSLKSYLLKAAQNKSIDYLRHNSIQNSYAELVRRMIIPFENDTENYVLHSDLQSAFSAALNKLPAELTETFMMNRKDLLSYSQIAQKQGVSVRTVEVRISKALVLLHKELKDYLLTILPLLPLIRIFCA